jgi:hypothetical protein
MLRPFQYPLAQYIYSISSARDVYWRYNYCFSKMKRKAQPATVEDVSAETDGTLPHTRRTASRPNKPQTMETPKRKRTMDRIERSRTKSAQSEVTGFSKYCGPILQAIRKHDGPLPLTILSGSDDHSAERNEVKGYPLRKFFYNGTISFCFDKRNW